MLLPGAERAVRRELKETEEAGCAPTSVLSGRERAVAWIAAGAATLLAARLFYRSLWAAALLLPLGAGVVRLFGLRKKRRGTERLRMEFIDGMDAYISALKTGYSAENALYETTRQLRRIYGKNSLLAREFARMQLQLSVNETLESLFIKLAARTGIEETARMADIIGVAKRSGGALYDINISVEQGEFIYIIGKVGSGKSSLLKTFYCEVDIPEETEMAIVLERDLKTIKRKEIPNLRKEMGIVFQDFQLLHNRNVYSNLAFVLKATGWKNKQEIENRIDEVLDEVGLEEKKYKMPHELSGGEQQRVVIARAMLNKPKIIIADEPTGNLDHETAEKIVAILRKISKSGTSVVMSTHNLAMINKYPGIVYKCKDGKIEEITSEFNDTSLSDEE